MPPPSPQGTEGAASAAIPPRAEQALPLSHAAGHEKEDASLLADGAGAPAVIELAEIHHSIHQQAVRGPQSHPPRVMHPSVPHQRPSFPFLCAAGLALGVLQVKRM